MAIEFLLAKNCKFKEENEGNPQFLFDMIKKTIFVINFPRFLKIQTHKSDEEVLDLKVTFEEIGINSQSVREVSAEIEPNLFWSENCKGCLGNVTEDKFGCYGRVAYPLSAEFEELLVKKLPSKDTLAYELLKKSVQDFPVDSGNLNKMRESGLLESKTGVKAKIKESLFKNFEVSSDNFLNMLFLSGETLGVSHMMMICLFFGLIPEGTTIDQIRDKEYLKAELQKSLQHNHFQTSKEYLLIRALMVSVISGVPLSLSI